MKPWFSTSEMHSHPGHRSTSIPEGKISSLPIVVAIITSKPEAGIFRSAAPLLEAVATNRLVETVTD
jgi:hypothetical protein